MLCPSHRRMSFGWSSDARCLWPSSQARREQECGFRTNEEMTTGDFLFGRL
ncbi:unnamed protein product [Polarella glacialis]|uniref:Uncharacterized protein n=1 Tax=Polarella glacialis TaxID=89957 RepID=A0A813FBU5_POLGL|nr:unnamed protein product [Polarella glacialis]